MSAWLARVGLLVLTMLAFYALYRFAFGAPSWAALIGASLASMILDSRYAEGTR